MPRGTESPFVKPSCYCGDSTPNIELLTLEDNFLITNQKLLIMDESINPTFTFFLPEFALRPSGYTIEIISATGVEIDVFAGDSGSVEINFVLSTPYTDTVTDVTRYTIIRGNDLSNSWFITK